MTTDKNKAQLTPAPKEVIVRMYRHGLGDCYLLAFRAAGRKKQIKYVLIDCGIHIRQEEGKSRLAEVMQDIVSSTGGHLDVLVVTHEHADHISGFVQKGSPFLSGSLDFETVWLAWTEIPSDPQASRLRKNKLNSKAILDAALKRLEQEATDIKKGFDALPAQSSSGKSWRERAINAVNHKQSQIASHLEFDNFDHEALSELDQSELEKQLADDEIFNAKCDALPLLSVASTVKNKKQRLSYNQLAMTLIASKGSPKYCEPGEELRIKGVDNVAVHVLGPPRNDTLIKKDKPSKVRGTDHEYHETYISKNQPSMAFSPLLNATNNGTMPRHLRSPFSEDQFKVDINNPIGLAKCITTYKSEPESWRKIDADWLADTEQLALSMEGDTNNTSLVLAFELGEPGAGDVLLFCGDAQVGNWLSWRDQKYGAQKLSSVHELFDRTLLYKVGHHGSHNATLKKDRSDKSVSEEGSPYGLALMKDIIAMINVDKSAVQRKMPVSWRMPHKPLYETLREKSKLRVLRADDLMDPLHKNAQKDRVPNKSSWADVPELPDVRWRRASRKFEKGTKTWLYYDIAIKTNRRSK